MPPKWLQVDKARKGDRSTFPNKDFLQDLVNSLVQMEKLYSGVQELCKYYRAEIKV